MQTPHPDEHDTPMMALALEQAALAAAMGEVPVGAVVHQHGRVLAAAHNRREIDQDPTAHAEILALKQAAAALGSWRLEDCQLVVTLEPCPMCAGALVNARIARLVYGAADPKMGCVDSLHRLCDDTRFNHRMAITSGVLADQCASLLIDFFRARRKPKASPDTHAGNTSHSHDTRGHASDHTATDACDDECSK